MSNIYMPTPTDDLLKENAEKFYQFWNFPNCCMSIAGKHIRIVCPPNTGSLCFNYKEYFSTVLLADCKFVAIDVGSYGGEGDAGVYERSNLGQKINAGQMNFLAPTKLPGTELLQPYPYPQASSAAVATYNYRHCRARRTSENAFGILCQYFRIFFTPIAVKRLECVDNIIFVTCILHNMLRQSKIPCPDQITSSNPSLPVHSCMTLAP
ncbi:protein ALP1-like, partial [Agrilus planipennis]|uniref:Protein ALP1-like n=1 Tax=Agrilus planipennis TaxID=224129 RepID=A0A7F5REF0_AGRPL